MHCNNNPSITGRLFLCCLTALFLIAAVGCATWTDQKGVINKWRDDSVPPFEKGRTTQSDVIEALGPPSQVIALKDQVILYYLYEDMEGRAALFILFNWIKQRHRYDRAIFFFNEERILVEYAYSVERAPYEEEQ